MWRSGERELDEELRRARPAAEFHEDRIRDRTRETIAARERRSDGAHDWLPTGIGPWGRAALIAAASLTLFVSGAEYGRRTAAPAPVEGPDPVTSGVELPLSIQSTGSEYVATLAGLAARAETLSPEQRRVAEEVALTVLYAAIVELGRASDDDRALQSAAGLVSARRDLLHRGPPFDPNDGSRSP